MWSRRWWHQLAARMLNARNSLNQKLLRCLTDVTAHRWKYLGSPNSSSQYLIKLSASLLDLSEKRWLYSKSNNNFAKALRSTLLSGIPRRMVCNNMSVTHFRWLHIINLLWNYVYWSRAGLHCRPYHPPIQKFRARYREALHVVITWFERHFTRIMWDILKIMII